MFFFRRGVWNSWSYFYREQRKELLLNRNTFINWNQFLTTRHKRGFLTVFVYQEPNRAAPRSSLSQQTPKQRRWQTCSHKNILYHVRLVMVVQRFQWGKHGFWKCWSILLVDWEFKAPSWQVAKSSFWRWAEIKDVGTNNFDRKKPSDQEIVISAHVKNFSGIHEPWWKRSSFGTQLEVDGNDVCEIN